MAFRETPVVPPADTDDEIVSVSEAARLAVIDLEQRGRLTPRTLVDAARDPRSPLHASFTWNDGEAAENWRLEEARRLIRSVKVVIQNDEVTVVRPRYVRDVERGAEQGYVSATQAAKEPENAKAIARYEFERAASHCERAIVVAGSLGVKDDAADVLAKIRRLLTRLS